MKTKQKKYKIKTNVWSYVDKNATAHQHPWENHKTKESAWRGGVNAGKIEAVDNANQQLKEENEKLRKSVESSRLESLREICQSGATIIDAMSHALLSYDKNL